MEFFYLIGEAGENGYLRYTETLNSDFVDVLGSGYVIDHCIAAFQKEQQEKAFNVYLTDALMAIANNTSALTNEGQKMSGRYFDIIDIKPKKKEETADEIILRLKGKINGCI